jgi:hypothetical protein
MGVITLALIALLYALSAAIFAYTRNIPQTIMSIGALLILIGQIWQIVEKV